MFILMTVLSGLMFYKVSAVLLPKDDGMIWTQFSIVVGTIFLSCAYIIKRLLF